MPAGSSEARRSVSASTAPSSRKTRPRALGGVGQPQQPGGAALAGGVEQGADRLAGQGRGGVGGGGEHGRDAGPGRDPGRLDLGVHAAGPEARGPDRADLDRREVRLAVHVGDRTAPSSLGWRS